MKTLHKAAFRSVLWGCATLISVVVRSWSHNPVRVYKRRVSQLNVSQVRILILTHTLAHFVSTRPFVKLKICRFKQHFAGFLRCNCKHLVTQWLCASRFSFASKILTHCTVFWYVIFSCLFSANSANVAAKKMQTFALVLLEEIRWVTMCMQTSINLMKATDNIHIFSELHKTQRTWELDSKSLLYLTSLIP